MSKPGRIRPLVLLLPATAMAAVCGWLQHVLGARAELADEPYRPTVRFFGRGGPEELRQALVQTGSAPSEAGSVARAAWRRLGEGRASFVVVASTTGAFHHVTAYRAKRRVVVGRDARGVRLSETAERLAAAEGKVRGSLLDSLSAAGVPSELAQDFLDMFRWSMDPSDDPKDGDRFRLVWSERVAGQQAYGRKLEAAAYDGAATGRHSGMRWDDEFFDRKGRSLRRRYLRAPMRYLAISSPFGKLRFSRLGWPMRRHRGTDYMAPTGTPIVCVADGTVSFIGAKPSYGNLVRVRHTGGWETCYGHLSRYGPGVRRSGAVRQGQVLGYVGATGNATGPHLHFELRRDGRTEDYRAAELPDAPLRKASRPTRFKARWRELFDL
ncbi:MAG: M23 family metallopeptidase [Elusimicrobia bacterium]|nr:M23 family metallopeptidase [Elusimicrobiota bacterium]